MFKHVEELAIDLQDRSHIKSIYELFSHYESHGCWMFTFNKVGLVTHRVHVLWLQVILIGKNVSQDQVRK